MSRLDPRTSIVARVALALAGIAVLVFAAVGALLYWTLERELMRVEFDEVEGKVALVRQLLEDSGSAGVDEAFRTQLEDVLAGHGNLKVWIHDRDGRLLFGDAAEPVHLAADGEPSLFTLPDGRTTSGCRLEVDALGPAQGAQVTVALADSMRGQVLGMYGRSVAWICGLGIAATALLAAWATRRGFRPVRRLAEHASRITPAALSVRLPLDGEDEELQGLAVSFNHALDRLQEAYARLESFNADVAHELRTPLATLISGTEVTLAATRSPQELEHLLGTQLELLQRLRTIVNDMLFLARADIGEQAADREPVSLSAEAGRVVEYYDGLIAEAGAQVRIDGDAQVRCNPGLVRRAISNLLSNALKYSDGAAPARIGIEISQDEREARLRVRNAGPTIPSEVLPRLFDRFYRGEPSRAPGSDSHGLGLAIVRAIARMHGGGVDAVSRDGITVVGFSLPK